MSNVKKAILEIFAVVLAVFTVVFLVNAYNKGEIGNKAEKVAKTFAEELEGTWYGKGEISAITFMKDGKTSLKILGVAVDGEFSDSYDIPKEKHTLKLKYKTIMGVSVEREFEAELREDKLTLTDNQLKFVTLEYRRSDGTEPTEEQTSAAPAAADKKEEKNKEPEKQDIETLQKNLIGEWRDSSGTNSGYEFKEDGSVTIKLLGVSYEGTYTVSVDEETGKNLIRITYAQLSITKVTNGYFAAIEDGVLTLTQRGAEKVVLNYTKVN